MVREEAIACACMRTREISVSCGPIMSVRSWQQSKQCLCNYLSCNNSIISVYGSSSTSDIRARFWSLKSRNKFLLHFHALFLGLHDPREKLECLSDENLFDC